MEEDNIKKATVPEEELDGVNAGLGGMGYYMMVDNYNGGYLPLCTIPSWDPANEVERLWPNCKVFTYGAIATGAGRFSRRCTYIRVCFNGNWGWAERDCMHEC